MKKIFRIIFKMVKLKSEKGQYISMIIALAMIVAIATAGGLINKNAIKSNELALNKSYGKFDTYILSENYTSSSKIKSILEKLDLNHSVLSYDPNIIWGEYPNDTKVFYVNKETYKSLTGYVPSPGYIMLAGKDMSSGQYKDKLVDLHKVQDNNKFIIQGTVDTLPQISQYMFLIPSENEQRDLPQFFLVDVNNSLEKFKELKKQLDEAVSNEYAIESSVATYQMQKKDLDNLEITLFAVVILICLLSTVLLYISIKELLMDQSQLWFILQTIGLSQKEVLLVMVYKLVISLLLAIVIGGLLGEYLGILACKLTQTDVIYLMPDFRYLIISSVTVIILFSFLLRWFKKNLAKNEIIQLVNKESSYINQPKQSKKHFIYDYIMLILAIILIFLGVVIPKTAKIYLFTPGAILLLIWVIRFPNKCIRLFSRIFKSKRNRTLRILGMTIENHSKKTGFMVSVLLMSVVLFISSVTIISTLKESANKMVDNIISYDYAVISTDPNFSLKSKNHDNFELIGKQLVVDAVANDSLHIKFIVSNMEDFKRVYKESSQLTKLKSNDLIASDFLTMVLTDPISVKIKGLDTNFEVNNSITSTDYNAKCVYFIKEPSDFKKEYLDAEHKSSELDLDQDHITYSYLYRAVDNNISFPVGSGYNVISVNQIKEQWAEITSQGVLPFQYFIITVLILVNIVFIVHIRNMLLKDANEFALLKVIGMKKTNIIKLIVLETISTFAIAVILAIAVAIPFTTMVMMVLTRLSNIKLIVSFDFKLIGLYIVINIFLLSMLSFLVGRKIANQNCIEAFKNTEVL